MAKTYNRLIIDVNQKPNDIITAVQADTNSRYLDVTLYNNGIPLDLNGHEVKIFMQKPENGGEIWNDGVITDAEKGRCEFLMTAEALSKMGHLQAQISIWKDNTEILSTQIFEINVTKTLLGNSSAESSNEYGTLVILFQNLYEAYELMTTMVENIGVPAEVAQKYDLATMWQAWEFLVAYMKGDFTDKVNEALANASVQGVLDKIGSSTDTGGSTTEGTLMGKSNAILELASVLHRQDDYLMYECKETVVLQEEGISEKVYKSTKLIGNIDTEFDCQKIVFTAECYGYYIGLNIIDADGNEYSELGYAKLNADEYSEYSATVWANLKFPIAVYLHTGYSGNSYCKNLTAKLYSLKRVISEEKYQAGTIKAYGYVDSYDDIDDWGCHPEECPRLDRLELKTCIAQEYNPVKSWSGADIIFVDNIPYVTRINKYNEYKILY